MWAVLLVDMFGLVTSCNMVVLALSLIVNQSAAPELMGELNGYMQVQLLHCLAPLLNCSDRCSQTSVGSWVLSWGVSALPSRSPRAMMW